MEVATAALSFPFKGEDVSSTFPKDKLLATLLVILRLVVITGTSSGLGKAATKALLRAGHLAWCSGMVICWLGNQGGVFYLNHWNLRL